MPSHPFLAIFVSALLLFAVSPHWAPELLSTPALADDDDEDDDDDDDDDDRPRIRPRPELVVIGLTGAEIAALTQRGYTVTRSLDSTLFQTGVVRILGRGGQSAAASLREIRRLAPSALAARNDRYLRPRVDLYRPQGEQCGERCMQFDLTGWTAKLNACELPASIGVIDTRIDAMHPTLTGARLETHTVRREGRRPSDPAHGTGVVSLIVGQNRTGIAGALPRANVIAVDPFHKSGAADATDAFDLVAALDILTERGANVINMSLSGPGNDVLKEGIRRMLDRGTTIVAAAGPTSAAGQGYPARYEGVVAVASVDSSLKPSRLSARGGHITYAGPGVGIAVAAPGGTARSASGTSFAAPFVSAAFAVARMLEPNATQPELVEQLRKRAKDLGAPGRDPIFGLGLIQFQEPHNCKTLIEENEQRAP